MDNLTQGDIKKLTEYCQIFSDNASQTLHNLLDKDVYKSVEIKTVDTFIAENLDDYKRNYMFYVTDYVKKEAQGTCALIIPEEIIASIADVIMGGSGEDSYKGSLSELEMNSTKDIFKNILKSLELFFMKIFDSELTFSTTNQIILKENENFEDEMIKVSKYNLLIKEELIFNQSKSYTFYAAFAPSMLKELMKSSETFAKQKESGKKISDTIDLDHLKNIKINITAELGHKEVPVKYALELAKGSVVELDTLVDQDINVYVHGIEVAKAQVVAVDDNFGLRITKIIPPEERARAI